MTLGHLSRSGGTATAGGTLTTEQFIADLERTAKRVLRDTNRKRQLQDRARKAHSVSSASSPTKSKDLESSSEYATSSGIETSSLASSSMSSSKELRSLRAGKALPPVSVRKKTSLAPPKQKIYDKLTESPFLSTAAKEEGALEQILDSGKGARPSSPVKPGKARSRSEEGYESEFQLKLSATDALAGRKQGSGKNYMRPKKEAAIVSEAQGPISFSHDGIRSKHRGEVEREEAWKANQRMLQLSKFAVGDMIPTPVIDRHPIVKMLLECAALENSRAKQRSAEDNSKVTYSYDLHELWLTNVEHLKEHRQSLGGVDGDDDGGQAVESGDGGLEGRRDRKALANMHSQIQSVSLKRAMQGAFYARAQAPPQLEGVPNFVPAPRAQREAPVKEPSLSMQVCGVTIPTESDDHPSVGSIPGASDVGRSGLWWRYKWDQERTQACGMFYRALSGASFESVHVRINLALDTPWLIEPVLAVVDPSHRPAKSPHQLVDCAPPTTAAAMCAELCVLHNEVCQRLSAPIVVLEELAQAGVDFISLESASPLSQLVRHKPEFTKHGFRQHTVVHTLNVHPELESVVFGISKQAATPNAPAVIPRNVWVDSIGELRELTRRRTPRDFKYMLVNTNHHGANEPIRFTIQMRNSQFYRALMSTYSSYEKQCAQIQELRDFQAKQAALDEKIAQAETILKQRKWDDEAMVRKQQQREVDRKLVKATATNRGWQKRMKDSDVVQVQGNWEKRQCRSSRVVFYRRPPNAEELEKADNQFEPSSGPPQEDYTQTCQWNPPASWKVHEEVMDSDNTPSVTTGTWRSQVSSSEAAPSTAHGQATTTRADQPTAAAAETSGIESITQALLNDDRLLTAIANKLGLKLNNDSRTGSEESPPLAPRRTGDDASEFSYDSGDELWSDSEDEAGDIDEWMDVIGPTPSNYREVRELIRERNRKRLEQATQEMCPVPMLILDKVHETRAEEMMHDESIMMWKRLPRPDLPKNFFQACVKTRTLGPVKASKNQPNSVTFVGVLDPVDACDYGLQGFTVPVETLFIPDARKDYERVVTAMEKHILREQRLAEAEIRTAELLIDGKISDKTTREQFIEKQRREQITAEDSEAAAVEAAIAAARHCDIAQLEDALACDIPVDTMDERGNTLFVIACQQGSKQLAKFLLRRGANINAQNIQGNTALHFCYTFGHIALAEYLASKGADERILNVFNMTCYEGTEPGRMADL